MIEIGLGRSECIRDKFWKEIVRICEELKMENERVSYVRNDCLVFFCVVVRE